MLLVDLPYIGRCLKMYIIHALKFIPNGTKPNFFQATKTHFALIMIPILVYSLTFEQHPVGFVQAVQGTNQPSHSKGVELLEPFDAAA
jgi:hypothetical protein